MKRIFTINLLLFLFAFSPKLFAQFTEADVKFWIGEGNHTAILVVDFTDETTDPSFAFGYRYNQDGTITFADLLQAVADAEPEFIFNQSDIGFLEDIVYNHHGGMAGHPDWWSTWSGISLSEMYMNNGISEVLSNGHWYGVSYGFMPEPLAPTVTYPAYSSQWFSFEDATFWIGEGENESVVVIDFNKEGETPSTFAWGIKYNGAITAKEALDMIAAADTELDITISENTINSISYNDLEGISSEENSWKNFRATNMSSWIISPDLTATSLNNGQWFGVTFGDASARRPFIPTAAQDNTSGISDHNKLQFTVYPNPVSSILNIEAATNIQKVEVFSITGQNILTSTNALIDLSSLTTGVYFVKVLTDKGSATQKIIKQ